MGEQRLVLVNGRFFLQPVTGVQRYGRELLAALADMKPKGFRFVVAMPGVITDGPAASDTVEYYSERSMLPGGLWQQLRLPWLYKKLDADLLWSPCNIGPLFAKNHVVTMHDASFLSEPGWFTRSFALYYGLAFSILGRTSRKIITVSEFTRDELVKYKIADARKITAIHEAVSPGFSPVVKKLFEFRYVLSVGSRNPRKNTAGLVSAWQSLPAELKNERKLVIAGTGAASYAAEGVGAVPSDVIFIDYVPDDDLPALYTGADLFVFPSYYEGFGLPPLEAMACGCPVVASNRASIPEVCKDAAYYVDPYSVEEIAEGLAKVLTDSELKWKLVQKGFQRVNAFSWKIAAERTLKVFDELLEQNNKQ